MLWRLRTSGGDTGVSSEAAAQGAEFAACEALPQGTAHSCRPGTEGKGKQPKRTLFSLVQEVLHLMMIVSTGHFRGVLREHAYVLRHGFPSPVCPCRLACVPHVVCSCRMLKVHVRAQELSEGRLRLVVRGGACASSCRQHESCRRLSKVDLLPNDRRQTCRRI